MEGSVELLFSDNETNNQRLFGTENTSAFVKDGINDYVVNGQKEAVNPERSGTKLSPHYILEIGAGQSKKVRLRLSDSPNLGQPFGSEFEEILQTRIKEADEFYNRLTPFSMQEDTRKVQR